jgi:hypothetical protein
MEPVDVPNFEDAFPLVVVVTDVSRLIVGLETEPLSVTALDEPDPRRSVPYHVLPVADLDPGEDAGGSF